MTSNHEKLLDLLTNILVTLSRNVGTEVTYEFANEYVRAHYAALVFNESYNKVAWIKQLRETIMVPGCTVELRWTPGQDMLDAMNAHNVYVEGLDALTVELWRKNMNLKVAKDFVDFMEACVQQVK